ncbi:MAG: AarF/ABC1/UbiB kinase family protein [Cyanobacteria bacterium]|nr:AarF/ABC1/UbiB kinase family protein [Cyanobacteria bacterium CG_2015-16_32_12]NCO77918.1 AarF/ABC1/UbiB kinase family protein [Cyanobacteria bacterium CG_2015-22_32_23]NCQ04457.1 AarF/ABC1/UbiB kinase family protein [Cyanobacteria bacterium CG_2015-09_32_10]NCQ43058.1 AarF/ABC1/UbiB kinase family protein [Cyanobacteria bacterium CG_2015-04_32_10]NCS86204.1 AarF/ABC1/UbiB kinase family protein [Cyanobacteria bacterium CG_2015-02_32_10]
MSATYPNPKEYLPSSSPLVISNKPEAGKKSYRWNRDNYSPARRRIDIWTFVLILIFKLWRNSKKWTYANGYTDEKRSQRRQIQAAWIRENLLELGPTFIKVGQLFSTREDIFPAEYVRELSKLQDRVPAFSFEQVTAIIEKDLGKPLNKLFRSFDPTPLAAASLGQVHKAQLNSGEEVVVKIQRPGLPQLFTIDLAILKQITRYFQNHPRWGKGKDWLAIYEECSRILWEETDYLKEGRSADTFRRNFRSANWVKVPRIYWRYTSFRVLTLEYLPGIKINHYEALEAAGLDRKVLAKLGAKAYLQQLLNDGFFHADPHPGNLAVASDGALIFYDFGMMGQLKSNVKEKLIEMLFGVTEKNADRVVNALIDLEALAVMDDPGPIRRSVQFMLDNFMDKPFEEQSISKISEDLYEIAYDQPFRFPATFTFVMRAFSTLEGVGKGLDPDFNFMEVAQPFALQIMSDFNNNGVGKSIFDEFSRQAIQVSNSALSLPRRLEDTIEKLERGDLRLRVRSLESERLLRRIAGMQMATNYSLFMSALILSSTILVVNGLWQLAIVVAIISVIPAFSLFRLLKQLGKFDRKL